MGWPKDRRLTCPTAEGKLAVRLRAAIRDDAGNWWKRLTGQVGLLNAWRTRVRMSRAGLCVSLPVCYAESGRLGHRRETLVCSDVAGLEDFAGALERAADRERFLRGLAESLKRLHRAGFLHGNLGPAGLRYEQRTGHFWFEQLEAAWSRPLPPVFREMAWAWELRGFLRRASGLLSDQERIDLVETYKKGHIEQMGRERLLQWIIGPVLPE